MTESTATDFTSSLLEETTGSIIRGGGQSQQLRVILSYLIVAMLALVMVGMGCAVDLKVVLKHLKKPTGVIVGVICQFVFMPLIAVLLATIFNMPEVETLSLLITGSCPGGSASNVAAYWVDGDMSLSVTMTTVSSILGLGVMPLLLFIYQEAFGFGLRVPFDTIGIALAALIVPIAIGVFIRWKFPRHHKKVLNVFSIFGIIAIIAVAVISIVTYGSTFSLIPAQIACAAIFPGVGMLLGYAFSTLVSFIRVFFLGHPQRRTVCLETGIQNAQLATGIIQLSQANFTLQQIGRMVLFPVIYLVSQIVWVILMIIGYQVYKYRCGTPVEPINEDDGDTITCKSIQKIVEPSDEGEKMASDVEKSKRSYEQNMNTLGAGAPSNEGVELPDEEVSEDRGNVNIAFNVDPPPAYT